RRANYSYPGTRFRRFHRVFRKRSSKKDRRTFPAHLPREDERAGRKSKRQEEMARCAYSIGIGSESFQTPLVGPENRLDAGRGMLKNRHLGREEFVGEPIRYFKSGRCGCPGSVIPDNRSSASCWGLRTRE